MALSDVGRRIRFVYQNVIPGLIFRWTRSCYGLVPLVTELDLKNAQGTAQLGTTLSVRMQIGPNIGQEIGLAMADKRNHLEHKKKPKPECIEK